MELRTPWNSKTHWNWPAHKIDRQTMAAFKDGDNSTDPRRCTAQSRQSGKRCKNASIPGGRVCPYHGGAAPHVQKKAAERLLALEHPAIDVFKRVLEADEAHPEHRPWRFASPSRCLTARVTSSRRSSKSNRVRPST